MDQIYKTVPEGAVVKREVLKKIIEDTDKIYAVITTGSPASDGQIYGPPTLLVVDVSGSYLDSGFLKGVTFSDTLGEMEQVDLHRFSIGEPMGNYFFTNYWHAYAYKLRTEL